MIKFTNSNEASVDIASAPALIVTILVNWNGADDTIECLESLLASDYPNQRLVVVDNGSKDNSLVKLQAWANGSCIPFMELKCDKKSFVFKKPPMGSTYNNDPGLGDTNSTNQFDSSVRLVLIAAEKNLGFAGGVNVGLRLALADSQVRYAWILNNDTVVASNCLSRMEQRMSADLSAGMCGSRVLYHRCPDKVQVLGGAVFNRWTGASYLIGSGTDARSTVDVEAVERHLYHLSGASMLVSRAFIEDVGLMDDGYFLYYEEADWAVRGQGRYRLVYADDAVVYHKEGASIGSNNERGKMSPLSAFFLIRSRLRFTRKFYPWALPTAFGFSAAVALRTLARGYLPQARAMLAALLGANAENALGWKLE